MAAALLVCGSLAGCGDADEAAYDSSLAAWVDSDDILDDVGDSAPPTDPCDGYDNDSDGAVDEDCYCQRDEQQLCFPGTPLLAGRGACQSGRQTCVDVFTEWQMGRWGECRGAVLPSPEICDNSIDDDCNGVVDDCGGSALEGDSPDELSQEHQAGSDLHH